MNLADDLKKLDELRASGSLTEDEFVRAKAALIAERSGTARAGPLPRAPMKSPVVSPVQRLDREWLAEREKYKVNGRWGARYIPGVISSAVGCFITVAIFLFYGMTSRHSNDTTFLWIFGAIGTLVLLGNGSVLLKAIRHKEAEERYKQRRAELLAKSTDSDASRD